MIKLENDFYQSSNVLFIAKELLGKYLCTFIDEHYCSGMILETEAYHGTNDKASHAYGGRKTARNDVMYKNGGIAYIYLCYGIHYLFNVVTNCHEIPDAVLIRAIKPIDGLKEMEKRRKRSSSDRNFSNGPGKVSQSLGISIIHNGISLLNNKIWIEDRGFNIAFNNMQSGKRIGIDYAEEDALLPYRFWINT